MKYKITVGNPVVITATCDSEDHAVDLHDYFVKKYPAYIVATYEVKSEVLLMREAILQYHTSRPLSKDEIEQYNKYYTPSNAEALEISGRRPEQFH